MHFPYRPVLNISHSLEFGSGTGRIILDRLSCNGTESELVDCDQPGIYNHECSHLEDVGLTCEGELFLQTYTHFSYKCLIYYF